MNFKSPYPWAESGRLCKVLVRDCGVFEIRNAEIIECSLDIDNSWDWCKCKFDDNSIFWIPIDSIKPVYTIDEIMQYADRTIIEEHWIDFNGNKRALYLKKFDGKYFRIDECRGSRKMKKIEI